MRRLRLAASAQLSLVIPGMAPAPAQRWFCLPEATQAAVLTLLAAMIARGVLVGEEVVGDDGD